MKKSKKKIFVVVCILVFICLDQITKICFNKDMMLIDGVLKFSNVQNTGGAFGIFNSNTIIIIISNIIILALMVKFIATKKEYMNKLVYIAVLFIIAGGISNLIDRVFRGYVVDFIDFSQIINFPVFNLADIVLVCGWILLIIGVLSDIYKEGIKNGI